MNNQNFALINTLFFDCCKRANTKPTSRQASKFRLKKGAAYKIGVLGMKYIHIPIHARIDK